MSQLTTSLDIVACLIVLVANIALILFVTVSIWLDLLVTVTTQLFFATLTININFIPLLVFVA